MTCPGSVVPHHRVVSEAEFKAAVLTGLAGCSNTGDKMKALAEAMDLSTKQVRNILDGASPGHKRMWDARSACPYVLDAVAALYGCAIVPAGDAAVERAATSPIATLLAMVAEAESPDSPGGTAKTHQELLAMEDHIRLVHALTGGWINEIDHHRAPTTVTQLRK